MVGEHRSLKRPRREGSYRAASPDPNVGSSHPLSLAACRAIEPCCGVVYTVSACSTAAFSRRRQLQEEFRGICQMQRRRKESVRRATKKP